VTQPTVVSFFSGIGGFDLGLERAGFRTIAFSEIDPFAIAVYRTHWPDAISIGSITDLAGDWRSRWASGQGADDLWTGGFPCQDLSVAGKRAGLAGERSGLALTFLDLVGRHRPRAILLENVPGLLSSNRGRDLAVLVGRLADMGYMGAFRVLDARWFGVAQRRRRIFILAFDDDALGGTGEQRAFQVLFEPEGRGGDPAPGTEAREGAAGVAGAGADIAGPLTRRYGKGINTTLDDGAIVVEPTVMAPAFSKRPGQQIATRDDGLSYALSTGEPPRVLAYGKAHRANDADDAERWTPVEDGITSTLDASGHTARTATIVVGQVAGSVTSHHFRADADSIPNLVVGPTADPDGMRAVAGVPRRVDDPLGMDSARYRVLGNAVAVPVIEHIGRRLIGHLR
jgi:DNA (cytosine-5)-methyltransferase 1